MANHVRTNMSFRNITEEGRAEFQRLMKLTDAGERAWFGLAFVGVDETTADDVTDYNWNTAYIGPKWCYVEEYGEDYAIFVSAWGYPEDGIALLLQQLEPVSEGVSVDATFEDEMPNFVGASVITSEGVEDSVVWEWEELKDIFNERIEDLAEHWDEEEEQWDDEGHDILQENMWEIIADLQSEWQGWN